MTIKNLSEFIKLFEDLLRHRGIINNDNIGAIYSPYSYYFYVSMVIFLYYISSKINEFEILSAKTVT